MPHLKNFGSSVYLQQKLYLLIEKSKIIEKHKKKRILWMKLYNLYIDSMLFQVGTESAQFSIKMLSAKATGIGKKSDKMNQCEFKEFIL